jgi:hypothetical protein
MLLNRSGIARAPPIGKTQQERLQNAIYYHESENLSIIKAANLAKVDRGTLSKFVNVIFNHI